MKVAVAALLLLLGGLLACGARGDSEPTNGLPPGAHGNGVHLRGRFVYNWEYDDRPTCSGDGTVFEGTGLSSCHFAVNARLPFAFVPRSDLDGPDLRFDVKPVGDVFVEAYPLGIVANAPGRAHLIAVRSPTGEYEDETPDFDAAPIASLFSPPFVALYGPNDGFDYEFRDAGGRALDGGLPVTLTMDDAELADCRLARPNPTEGRRVICSPRSKKGSANVTISYPAAYPGSVPSFKTTTRVDVF
jgi:hypothetical protein